MRKKRGKGRSKKEGALLAASKKRLEELQQSIKTFETRKKDIDKTIRKIDATMASIRKQAAKAIRSFGWLKKTKRKKK
jgi:predicted  nucleic acid-binding Zn-ribbon protein